MGVGIQEPAGSATRTPRTQGRRAVAAFGLLTVVSLALSVLGIGTGDGPLGPPMGYGASIPRDVGDEFTEGTTMLVNDGLFSVHIESIRPLPFGDGATGLSITAVELAPHQDLGVGMVDGPGYETVPRDIRRSPGGYQIPPERRVGERASMAEVLLRITVERAGVWTYRGYEVVYRSGFVRHRMVMPIDLQVCTPRGATCPAVDD